MEKYLLITRVSSFDHIDWQYSKTVLPIYIHSVSIKRECNYYFPFTYNNKQVIAYNNKSKHVLQ